jgi:hypothetical protein
MAERHEMLGQRAELKPQAQRLRVECEALRDRLRSALPIHEEVDSLGGENILTTAIALKTSLDELAGLNRKIDILNRELGA